MHRQRKKKMHNKQQYSHLHCVYVFTYVQNSAKTQLFKCWVHRICRRLYYTKWGGQIYNKYIIPDSLADAKVSARQQCITKAPSEEISSQSTIYNFLLMVNSNRGFITYYLRDMVWKLPISPTVLWLSTLEEDCPATTLYSIHSWQVHSVG